MKKTLNALYKRTETGAIQQWQIVADGNTYYTIEGLIGGKLTTSTPTICDGKNVDKANETTPEEQAYTEALAKWTKKTKKHYFEKIGDIDQKIFIKPMLAKHYKDYSETQIQWPVMVDRKYNGMRHIVSKDLGQRTREGEIIHTAPHIWEAIKHLFDKYPNLVIDSELYNHQYRYKLNELIEIVRKTVHFTAADLEKSKKIVKMYIYDGYGFDNITESTKCSERREALKKLFAGISEVVVVDYKWANNDEEVQKIYQEYLEEGYEGAILREDKGYEHKRSKNLLKIKPTDDDEFTITNIEEGNGNWSGAAKRITFKGDVKNSKSEIVNTNAEFSGCFKGSYEDGVICLKDKNKWIGKKVTIYYNGLTGKNIPNFAQFNYKNSLKGDR